MHITEKRLRRIIRSVILENEDSKLNNNQIVDDAIEIILKRESLEESVASKLTNIGMVTFGIKMTAPLLASLVIGYAHYHNIPIGDLAVGAVDMAANISQFFGITDNNVTQLIINVISGLSGASIVTHHAKEFMK